MGQRFINWRLAVQRIVLAVALGLVPVLATAQEADWPNRPIRIILPSAAGGVGDITSRLVAQKLSEKLGQQVVVENRTGGAGVVGSVAIAHAPPDGYTFGLLTASTHAASPVLMPDLPYNAEGDFAPIGMFADLPVVVAAYPGLPHKNIAELVNAAKKNPGTISNGWAATLPYLSALLFAGEIGTTLNNVPYKGTGQASMDLVQGRIDIQFGTIAPILALLRESKLRALAVTSGKRADVLPDVPTIGETVLPGFNSSLWMGYGAPRGTPEPIIRRLNRELVAVLQDPAMREAFAFHGVDVLISTPEEVSARIRDDIRNYKQVVAKTGVSLK